MQASPEFLKSLIDHLCDGVYYVDTDQRITYWNATAERMTGYSSAEVVGRACDDSGIFSADAGDDQPKACSIITHQTLTHGTFQQAELYLRQKNGARLPVLVRVAPVISDGDQIVGAIESLSDNTPKMQLLEQIDELERLAMLDALTQVPNRRYAETTLRARFNEFNRYQRTFGVLFIDVDHFKRVNDRFGHDVGDTVLATLGSRLREHTRNFDVVSRWGGEEFLVVVANVNHAQLEVVAEKLRAMVESILIPIDDEVLQVTISIGAALIRAGDTTESIVARADERLYHSKATGRNCCTMGH